MPQDPNLYGQPAPKKQRKEMPLSSSLAFTAQLTSLITKPGATDPSSSASASASAQPRPSRSKPDVFANVKAKRKGPAPGGDDDGRLTLRDVVGTEEDKAEAARARRRMEHKARLYAAMKRGDYVPREGEAAPLVDFDRKWAEAQGSSSTAGADRAPSSSSEDDDGGDDDDDNNDTELVEYEDEYGRLRRGTRAARARMEMRLRARALHAADEERMSARPRAPERVIYGDAVQAEAFEAAAHEDGRAAAMEALARRRDRSATPPESAHYDADREIRTKGAGFYKFSRGEEARGAELRGLEAARRETERARGEAGERAEARRREVEARRREIEERRRAMGAKRARKLADSFLDGLAGQLGAGEGATEGGGGGEGGE